MISPDDILAEARDLAKGAATEARHRSAVSRSYFACFHHVIRHPCAKDVVGKIDKINSDKITADKYTPGRHTLLIKGLVKSGRKELIFIAGTLQNLLNRQARADYTLSERHDARTSQEALALAESIFVALPA